MKKSFFVIILLLMVVYNANLKTIDSGDTQPAKVIPLSLLWNQSLYLDDFAQAWSGTLWPEDPYFLWPVDGHRISAYPVTQSILITPLYIPAAIYIKSNQIPLNDPRVEFIISITAKFASSLIAALTAGVLFLALSTMVDRPKSFCLALIYGLASSAWSTSSQSLWQHGPSQLAFATTVWLLVRKGEGASPFDLLGAGAVAGLAVTNRAPTAIFAALIAIYVLHRHGRKSWPFFLCPPFIAGLWASFNVHCYGHPLGWAAVVANPVGGVWYEGLAGLLVGPSRGLITYCPWVLASFWGCWRIWTHQGYPLILRYLSCAMVGQLVLYSRWPCWWGGSCFGPRMASDIFPLLIFLLIPAFRELSASKPIKILFGIAVIFSMTVQAAGSFLVFPAFTYADNQWNWSHSQLLNVARQPYLLPPRFWPNAPGFATVDGMLSLWRGAPRTLLDYSQKIEAPGCPTNVKPGEKFNIQVLCRNTGGQTWLDFDNSVGAFYISLSLSWLDSTGAVVEKSSVLIPSALDAGQSVTLAAPLQAPRTKGSYTLALSMAVNGDSFQNHGSPALILPVEVGAANEMASIDVGSPEGRPFLISGFSVDEKAPQLNFAWSVGRESTVSLKVDRDGPGRLVMNGFCLPPLKSVDVTVLVNDQESGLLQVGPQLANYSLVLNKPLRAGDNKLTFHYNKTGIPAQLQPGSGDQRDLSICWDTIRLEAGP